ncbi:hypothetical protein COLO4_24797 [Corchorus olitorius]|uniref:Uncharacterized protein n=1 Tax=Corchorus olitorius TaxID=93759 RepID=A0A1R3I6N6_9ROSI|nr:hypothetical protein COLO4_24797 [Corchorus olitorius]
MSDSERTELPRESSYERVDECVVSESVKAIGDKIRA